MNQENPMKLNLVAIILLSLILINRPSQKATTADAAKPSSFRNVLTVSN
jgi:hypothetical protein